MTRPDPELSQPLPPPPPDVTHLIMTINLRPPPPAGAPDESGGPEAPLEKWQDLEARWKAIEALEATIDTLRLRMGSLRADMEGSSKQTLTADEKVHAFNADVAQWNKAKSRVIYALPKVKEFIHRATWAIGTPERKELGEFFKDDIRQHVPVSETDKVLQQL